MCSRKNQSTIFIDPKSNVSSASIFLECRSLEKKGVHSHFRSLFSKEVRSFITLPKKEWYFFNSHLKKIIRPKNFLEPYPKLYIPSTLNIDLILWHTQLIVCADNVKSWFKSWLFPFTFQAYILPHTLNCMCVSLSKFHI